MRMNSLQRYMYDAAPEASLRAKNAAAITASGALAELPLDLLQGFWTDGSELADLTLAVVINVTAINNATGTYDIAVEGGPVGFATTKTLGKLNGVTRLGQHVILLDMATIEQLKTDVASLRLNVTANDTDGAGAGVPSISFFSWVAPINND
jgi:hypothetical protein